MSNANDEPMDGVFTTSTSEPPASPSDQPIRPPKPKTSLGRETKVGIGVIGALLVIFIIVLVIRLRGSGDGEIAKNASGASDGASDAGERDGVNAQTKSGPTVINANSGAAGPRYWGDAAANNQDQGKVGAIHRANDGRSGAGLLNGNPVHQVEQNKLDSPNSIAGTKADQVDSSGSESATTADTERSQLNKGWPSTRDDNGSASVTSAQRTKSGDPFGTRRQETNNPTRGSAYGDSAASLRGATPDEDRNQFESINPALVDGNGSNRVGASSDEASTAKSDPFRPAKSEANIGPAMRGQGGTEIADDDASELKIVADDANAARSREPDPSELLSPVRGQIKSLSQPHANHEHTEAPAFSVRQTKNPFADRSSNAEGVAGAAATSSKGEVDMSPGAGAALSSAPKFNAPRADAPPAKLDESLIDGQPAARLSDRGAAPSNAANYTVQANETYWTISERTYGSGAYFKAVYEYNRRQQGNAERLQAGMRLSLPDEATLQRLYPQLCPKPRKDLESGSRATRASADSQVEGRSYVVENGDTLYEIARTRLGKSSRWAEIYELNRDVLGEAVQHLQPGTRLLLPQSANLNRIQ